MNIVPVYPNFVPLAQQPATEAARRDNVRRERIPEPAESTSGQTDNRLDSSSESSPRYASTTSADTYSAASVKHNALKNSNEGGDTQNTPDKVSSTSDQSKRKEQTSSEDESSSKDKNKEKQEEKAVQDLKKRDAEVRTHEQAHKSAGGQYAGSPAYEMTRGPDGKSYATGGHVNIDVSPIPDDPQATLTKMAQIKKAALAPTEPSSQDLKVAARADMVSAAARSELQKQSAAKPDSESASSESADSQTNSDTQPFISQQMRRRGLIVLNRYSSSGRPSMQTATNAYA